MKQSKISVVVPMYNEQATIETVLNQLDILEFVGEIIVVDDGSSDQSVALTKAHPSKKVKLIQHDKNAGKTAALKTGFQAVTLELIVIQDADLEYDPQELVHVCEPLWSGRADVVYGSRFLVRKAQRVLYFYHYLGNCTITFFSNLFTNKNMTDVETCYKAFRASLIKDMPIISEGFGFEIEVTAKVSKTNARIYETPISYYGRTFEEGKKITWLDGVAAIWYIIKFNIFLTQETKNYISEANRNLSQIR
ncbi:MAG: glycosyltransferase family 2 protein [Arenicellaceae bacterium]|nr:glycosyltransferase family 2 protein [Arenicellaceae bacterium]